MRPWTLIFIGLILSLLGFLLPLLMVIHVITSTFFLNFFSGAIMFVGLALGIIGASQYVQIRRKK